jgi:hypothetical protein
MAGGIKKFVVGCFDDEAVLFPRGEECSPGWLQDPRCLYAFPGSMAWIMPWE